MHRDYRIPRKVDVICQHSSDGTVIPLRIRLMDDDGEMQIYNIQEYKDISHKGCYTTPDGIYVTKPDFVFECKIVVIDTVKRISLYYCPSSAVWTMTA